MVTATEFREAMRHWPTGVAIVTSYDSDGRPEGMTLNSLVSISLQPPLLMVSLAEGSRTLTAVEQSKLFAVSILADGSQELCWTFARNQQERSFDGFSIDHDLPVVQDALVKLVCRVHQMFAVADHVLVIGEVIASGTDVDGSQPLVFCSGSLQELSGRGENPDGSVSLFEDW